MPNDWLRHARQRVVDLQSGRVVAKEALARLVRYDKSVVAAADLYSPLRLSKLAQRIDRDIFQQVLTRWATHPHPDVHRHLQFINASAGLPQNATLVGKRMGAISVRRCPAQRLQES